jgi:hypothetical protein
VGQSQEIGIRGVVPQRGKKPPENSPPGMKAALAWKNI